MSKYFIILFLFAFRSLLVQASSIAVVPAPKHVERGKGWFAIPADSLRIALLMNNPTDLETGLKGLGDALSKSAGCRIVESQAAVADIIFGVPLENTSFAELCRKFHLFPGKELGNEGYRLLISKKKILASANTQAGLFYATQTLIQLLRGQSEPRLPCLKITDWPDMKIRGVLDDISRGPIPTMSYFKQCIRRFAELKINALTYYTENVVRTKKHGDFAPPGALTIKDIKELSAYAQKYHIDLMGCFQSFGHFEKILEYPQYAHLGEMGSLLSPAFPDSYRLLADIYSELAPAYQSKYFLVLGDELWALGKGASESMLKEKGFARVFADHINWIDKELGKYGKTILVTADEPLKHPKSFDHLKKDIIMLPWEYSAKTSFADMLAPIHDHGFQMLVTPGISCWRKIYPNLNESKANIQNFIHDGISFGALGALTTTWDDWGINFFSNNWYGIAWAAEQSWHSSSGADVGFSARFSSAVYADQKNQIGAAVEKIASLYDFPELQNMEATIFWNSLIPAPGAKGQISLQNWDAIKIRANGIKKNVKQLKPEFYANDILYIQYVCDQIIYMADYRRDLVNAGSSYRGACLEQRNRETSRRKLVTTIRLISELQQRWQALWQRYRYLWRLENRNYWLDNVDAKFKSADDDFADVLRRLDLALDDFDKGFPLPPPTRVRLDIRKLEQQFFQTWLLCGSFPNPKKDVNLSSHAPGNCIGFDTDYLKMVGGESGAAPQEGDAITRPDGSVVKWRRHRTKLGAKVDLKNMFDKSERVVAYAYCEIGAPKDLQCTAALGSNDGIKVFLNGAKVFEKHELRFVKIDEDTVKLDLKKGINRLLIKIDQGRGEWGFVFRLVNQKVRNNGWHYTVL